jgi:hypothetical protein
MPLVANRKPGAVMRPLDPSDPRNPAHPANRQAVLDLWEAIGRERAAREWRRKHGKGDIDDNEAGGILRKVF